MEPRSGGLEYTDPTNRVRLDDPSDGFDDEDPVWSPDGTRVAYTHNLTSHPLSQDVWTMDADDGGNKFRVTSHQDPEFSWSWQPSPTPPCTITGTAQSDDLTGSAGPDVICGLRGNDTIRGAEGADILIGGRGHDSLLGGPGGDELRGEDGTDTAAYAGDSAVMADLNLGTSTGQGSDTLIDIENISGSDANDILYGSAAGNELLGRAGDDDLFGRNGDDNLLGGNGNDDLDGGRGLDVCRQGAGTGTVTSCP